VLVAAPARAESELAFGALRDLLDDRDLKRAQLRRRKLIHELIEENQCLPTERGYKRQNNLFRPAR
jgi:hypothetical protein